MNRRRRIRLVSVVAGLIIAVLVPGAMRLATQEATGGDSPGPPASVSLRASDVPLVRDPEGARALRIKAPGRLPLFEVDRVIDGDTLVIRVGETTERVRVFGLDAPERDERCGTEATEALRRAAGSEVRLLPDDRLEDRYGRELRYLFTSDGSSIDAQLIAAGAAEAWREDGAYRDTLTLLEAEAREAGAGCLWG